MKRKFFQPIIVTTNNMQPSKKQIKFLRTKAHALKPVIIIGNAGISDAVINETNLVLETHELIKIRVNAEDKQQRREMTDKIISLTESVFVQLIGHVAIVYRARKKNPEIQLPKDK